MESKSGLRKVILIVKTRPGSMGAVEQFLRNRDWQVHGTGELREALEIMVKHKPEFILISIDHPDPKIKIFPKILAQAFPVCVMAYAERASVGIYRSLQSFPCEIKINPPITGPAIERAVNKFIKDQLLPKTKTPSNNVTNVNASASQSQNIKMGNFSFDANSSANQSVKIQGSQTAGSDTYTIEQLGKMLSDENIVNIETTHHSSKSSTAQDIPTKNSIEMPRTGPRDSLFIDPQNLQAQHEPSLINLQKKNAVDLESDPNRNPANFQSGQESHLQNSTGRGEQSYQQNNNSFINNDPTQMQTSTSISTVFPDQSAKDNSNFPPVSYGNTEPTETQVMAEATQKSLEETSRGNKIRKLDPLKNTSQVACIEIQSSNFSGYLVAAMGNNRAVNQDLISEIKQRIFKFLQEKGIQIEDHGDYQMKLKPVAFEDWSLECANFLRKSIHQGSEIAMAFFPGKAENPALQESILQQMGAIKIEDLIANVDLEFNLYIYLPANRKYVLYTPIGSIFYANQKDRLAQMNVTHMHMRREETRGLSVHRVRNFLNRMISEYEKNKSASGGAKAS